MDKFAVATDSAMKKADKSVRDTTGGWGRNSGAAFAGGQNAGYRAGMVAQQAQDIAVQMQMGASASRVIAQQGSQIASLFGPYGMILGGVIAISAALWDAGKATESAEEKMKRLEKSLSDIKQAEKDIASDERDARISTVRRIRGNDAADDLKRRLEYEQEIEEIKKSGLDIAAKMNRQTALTKAYEAKNAEIAENRAIEIERSWQKEKEGFAKKAAQIQDGIMRREKEWSDEESDRLKKRIDKKKAAEQYVKDVQERVGRDFDDDENARLRRRMDKAKEAREETIEKGAAYHEKLKEATFGKSQAEIRKDLRAKSKMELEETKWKKKMEETGGLVDIKRDISGKVISGIDPVTGKRISGKEAKQRAAAAALALAEKDKKDEVKITDDSIKSLVAAIEKLITK